LCGDRTQGLDSEAEEPRRQFDAAAWRASTPVVLQTGDLAIVNNRTTMHGRGEIPASHAGSDRWHLRMSVAEADLKTQLGARMTNGFVDTQALL
jgi:L-asparagine oxygenase